ITMDVPFVSTRFAHPALSYRSPMPYRSPLHPLKNLLSPAFRYTGRSPLHNGSHHNHSDISAHHHLHKPENVRASGKSSVSPVRHFPFPLHVSGNSFRHKKYVLSPSFTSSSSYITLIVQKTLIMLANTFTYKATLSYYTAIC